MGELESLLLVLALIYLSECLVWVRRGALAFGSWRGNRFGLRPPGTWMGNQRGGLLLSNPFPPLGTVFIVPNLPLSLAPAALFAYSSVCLDPAGRPWQTARHLSFDDVRNVAVDGIVSWLNPKQQHPVHSLPPGFGIRFQGLSPDAHHSIQDLVDEYLARHPGAR